MQQVGAQQPGTNTTVTFEFKLEVKNVQKVGSTQDVLNVIDGEILGSLQARLPDYNEAGLYIVKFDSIESEIFNQCFTDSDQCSYVRSTIFVVYQDARPESAIRTVTLQLVEDYLSKVASTYKSVRATYTYPMMVQTLADFELSPVSSEMNTTEINVLENTFVEVFGALVYALEGDTEVVDAKFLYQDVDDGFSNVTGYSSTLTAELRVAGYCRDCTASQFESVVVGVIGQNLQVYLRMLKENSNSSGSAYFDSVSNIVFSIPQPPPQLPPSKDSSIFDQSPPDVETKQPWFLWFGLALAILIICGGCYIVIQDTVIYEKDEYSTGDSSNGENEEFQGDGDAEAALAPGTSASKDEMENDQVETVAGHTEDGNASNYEVYVF